MDDDLPVTLPGVERPVPTDPDPVQAAPMGRGFWAVMALIGILILLIIYAQVQGVTRPVAVNLTGTSWTLTYYVNGDGTMIPAMNGTVVNLSFGPDNATTLGGYAGCNRYWYQYTVSNSTLAFSGGETTGIVCSTRGVMQAEFAYLQDLNNTSAIRFRSGYLTIYDSANKPLLIFEQTNG